MGFLCKPYDFEIAIKVIDYNQLLLIINVSKDRLIIE